MNAETFEGLWMISEPFANRMEGIILPRLAAGFDPFPQHFMAAQRPPQISWNDKDGEFSMTRYYLREYLKAGGNDIAVVPLQGAMSRFGLCGFGNEFIMSIIEEAANEPACKGMVIKGNTPGGTVDSTEALADTIRNFPKRKVGYVNGSVYSAGVLAMSQCDEIVMENSVSAGFGSIGVLYVHMDQSGALEKAGVKPKIIRATKSVNKARVNGIEPLTDELESRIQAEADEAMVMFEGYVRRGRVGKLKSDDVFSGDEFNKKESMAYGLVDRTGNLSDAIKAARKL